MFRLLFLFIVWIVIGSPLIIYAQESRPALRPHVSSDPQGSESTMSASNPLSMDRSMVSLPNQKPRASELGASNELIFKQLESGSLSIKNPFKSQIPKKIITAESTCADGIQYCLTLADCTNQGHYWYNNMCHVDPEKTTIHKDPFEPSGPTGPLGPSDLSPPLDEPDIPLPVFTVSGVIWNSDRPQAIVNEQIVDIGDTIAGAVVTNIQKSGIDILFNGKTVNIQTQRSEL